MEIEFDPDKDAVNRDKHGVSLAFGVQVLGDDNAVVLPSWRSVDGELWFKAMGWVADRLWTAVIVRRGTAVRFISGQEKQ